MSAGTPVATTEALEDYIGKYSNWGRWGEADEVGAVNLITRTIVRNAARSVRTGRVVGLGLPFDQNGPQTGLLGRFNCLRFSIATGTDHAAGLQTFGGEPFPHGFGFADDVITMPLQSASHWDVLSHIFHEGSMYNGRPASAVGADGSKFSGVEKWREHLVGRAVLLDMPATLGLEWLDDGHAITADQLDAAAEFGRVKIREGDILLLRTGRLKRARAEGWGSYAGGGSPGLSYYTIPWLASHGVAAVASDTWGVEVRPNELEGAFQPFHIPALVYMGLALGEMFDFEGLSEACADEGRYEMFFSAPPLAFTGAAGAPPGPVAVL